MNVSVFIRPYGKVEVKVLPQQTILLRLYNTPEFTDYLTLFFHTEEAAEEAAAAIRKDMAYGLESMDASPDGQEGEEE